MPSPNMIPAKVRFAPPSPKANVKPPMTMAMRASPLAIGPVNASCRTLAAFSQGELACRAKAAVVKNSVAPVATKHLQSTRFKGLLGMGSNLVIFPPALSVDGTRELCFRIWRGGHTIPVGVVRLIL